MLLVVHVAIVIKPAFALRNGHVQILPTGGFDIEEVRAFSGADGAGIDFLSVVLIAHLANSIVANIFDPV